MLIHIIVLTVFLILTHFDIEWGLAPCFSCVFILICIPYCTCCFLGNNHETKVQSMNFMLFSDNTQDTDTNVFPMIKHPFHQPRRSGCCYNVEMFSSFPSFSIKEHEHMFGYTIFLKKPLTSRFHLDGIRRLLVFFPMAITFMYCLLASYTPSESKLRAKKNISCQCPTPQKP